MAQFKPNEKLWNAIPKDKYAHSGIYCIKVNNKIVYIGKSKDMRRRVYEHMVNILYPTRTKENKYFCLNTAKKLHNKIEFDVLEYHVDEFWSLDRLEEEYINKYLPVLNTMYASKSGMIITEEEFINFIS